MDRKYRQCGYQDSPKESKGKKEPRPRGQETFGPRALQMPGTRTISRCAQCGAELLALTEPLGQCPKCGFELHSCKQCAHFDPAARFECTQPVPERIPRKDTLNRCTFFAVRVKVEKETSSSAPRVDDARRAFDNLFKK